MTIHKYNVVSESTDPYWLRDTTTFRLALMKEGKRYPMYGRPEFFDGFCYIAARVLGSNEVSARINDRAKMFARGLSEERLNQFAETEIRRARRRYANAIW